MKVLLRWLSGWLNGLSHLRAAKRDRKEERALLDEGSDGRREKNKTYKTSYQMLSLFGAKELLYVRAP